jgi:hypothetical protein
VSVSSKKANRKSTEEFDAARLLFALKKSSLMTQEPSIPAILCFDLAFLLGYVSWALWQLEKNDQDE